MLTLLFWVKLLQVRLSMFFYDNPERKCISTGELGMWGHRALAVAQYAWPCRSGCSGCGPGSLMAKFLVNIYMGN